MLGVKKFKIDSSKRESEKEREIKKTTSTEFADIGIKKLNTSDRKHKYKAEGINMKSHLVYCLVMAMFYAWVNYEIWQLATKYGLMYTIK